jgi:membrane protease YdiL (CAAX protease family)
MENAKNAHISRFNPLAWGILFFTLWLTLRAAGELNKPQEIISWAFLAVSVILFLSIFISPLARILSTKTAEQLLIPTIFFLSIFGFTFAYAGKLKAMFEKDLVILETYIATIFGFLWVIAYLLILTRSVSKYFGIAFSAVFFVLGVYILIREANMWGGIIVMVIGVTICLVATRVLPINYPPLFGDKLED